jgi:hypothetical protein
MLARFGAQSWSFFLRIGTVKSAPGHASHGQSTAKENLMSPSVSNHPVTAQARTSASSRATPSVPARMHEAVTASTARHATINASLRTALAVAATFALQSAAHAALAAPTLNTPAAFKSAWLFNKGTNGQLEQFTWSSVSGATSYEFAISDRDNFGNYDATLGRCVQSGCHSFITSAMSGTPKDVAGYIFLPTTYYWRVRAIGPNGVRGPWSSQRYFTTSNRAAVVAAARSYAIGNAPPSQLTRSDGTTPSWLTDLDNTTFGDNVYGAMLLKARATYGAAPLPRALGTATAPSALRTQMRTNLTRTTGGWLQSEQDLLIDRIAATFSSTVATRANIMAILGVRTMCKEFVDRAIIAGGGTPKNLNPTSLGSPRADARPGDYVIKSNLSHTMLANAIIFNSNGARQARLSEANFGSGWSSPSDAKGQVPWLRKVDHARTVEVSTTGTYRAYSN